ncbi:MAG: dodecin family protein [Nitrososphaera sp.]|uniref:dodecin family protein n=1 Tax=Nitrososphaera sp. TaxID=1971748 RepID=UPI003D6DBF05
MAVVKIMELVSSSPTSWQDAVDNGIKRAVQTVRNVSGVDVLTWKVDVQNDKITEYRVSMKVAFAVEEESG